MFGAVHRLLKIAVLSASCLLAASPARAQATYSFDIPSQPLAEALRTVGHQTSTNVMFEPRLVRNLRAPALRTQTTTTEAIRLLLVGTELSAVQTAPDSILIQRAERSSAAGNSTKPVDDRQRAVNMRLADGASGQDATASSANSEQDATRAENTDAADSKGVEEIIVTATKRAENLQDVPMSIGVVSAQDIDRRGLVSAEDYLRGIPGVNQITGGTRGQSIIIRGLETGTEAQNFWSGTTVATYFGETPTTTSAGLAGGTNVDLKVIDIERVEILRGPQGTAFGSSSMGGAVRTIPVAPKLDRFEGNVGAGYSATSGTGGDNYNIRAVGNIPLIKDRLALRATAYQFEESGYYRNGAASDPALQAAVVTRYGAQAFAVDEDDVGGAVFTGGRIAALFQVTDDLRLTLSYLKQKTERDGIAESNSGVFQQSLLQVAPEHVRRGQKTGLFDTDIDIANAVMEYGLGWANLLATYSYTKSGSFVALPYTSIGIAWPASVGSDSEHSERVGEIRLATQFQGAWNFLVGLYAERLTDDAVYDYYWHGDPTTSVLNPKQRYLGIYPDSRVLEQKAAFGEVSWKILPRLTITGGVRAYDHDRHYQVDASGVPFFGPNGTHVRETRSASGTSFRGNVSYALNDDAMIYASWAEGFRLGHLQNGLAPGQCDLNNDGIIDGTSVPLSATRSVNPDAVDSYELGAKFSLADRRVTVAADVFVMDWSQIPVLTNGRSLGATAPSCISGYLTNAGSARSEGVELQTNFQVTDALRIDAGASWIHARLVQDVPAIGAADGNRLPGAPKVNASLGLQYDFRIGGRTAFVRADGIYIGPFFGNVQESINTEAGDYVKLDASARVMLGSVGLDLYVRNLTDEDAFTGRAAANYGVFHGYRLRPRTIGMQAVFSF